MTDKKSFSATDFIKKQYGQSTSSSPETSPNEPSNSEAVQNPVPPAEITSEKALSGDAIRLIVQQYLSTAKDKFQTGRGWEAIGIYKAGLQLAPDDLDLLTNLAEALIKVNERKEAVQVLVLIAQRYERDGKVEESNQVYEKIYTLDSDNELACSVLGRKPEHLIPYPEILLSEINPVKEETSVTTSVVQESIAELPAEPIIAGKTNFNEMKEVGNPQDNPSETSTPAINREGPKPVDELLPLEVLTITPPANIPFPPEPILDKKPNVVGPQPVQEIIPLDLLSKSSEVAIGEIHQKTIPLKSDALPPPVISEFDPLNTDVSPPVISKTVPIPIAEKSKDVKGPQPVEELIPLDSIPTDAKPISKPSSFSPPEKQINEPPVISELIPLETVLNTTRKDISSLEEKKDIKDIPFPPMPEVKVEPVSISEQPPPVVSDKKIVIISGSPQEKMNQYLEILAMDPENIDARTGYISEYLEVGLEQELVDDYLELANAYRNQGNREEAIKYYEKVLFLDPSVKEAQKKLAQLKGASNPEAVSANPQVVKNASTSVPALDKQKGPMDDKQADKYLYLLQINPLNETIARRLAEYYRGRSQLKEAVEVMTILGDAYMQRNMNAKAEVIYDELFKEVPSEEMKERLNKSRQQKKSMEAISKAIKSYTTEVIVDIRKNPPSPSK